MESDPPTDPHQPMNLVPAPRTPPASKTPPADRKESKEDPLQQNKQPSSSLQLKDASSLLEKSDSSMMPPSLHLIQSQLGISPHQFQSIVQQQQQAFAMHHKDLETERKQLAQLLQMNLFQQAHILQGNGTVKPSLEQLQLQQQQMMSQLQHEFSMQSKPSSAPTSNGYSPPPPAAPISHPLYSHGVCRWTGCEAAFESVAAFTAHLNKEHVLSDRSTAQTRVQVQIVSQLEIQLKKEKDRLEAMMAHLHPEKNGADVEHQQAKPDMMPMGGLGGLLPPGGFSGMSQRGNGPAPNPTRRVQEPKPKLQHMSDHFAAPYNDMSSSRNSGSRNGGGPERANLNPENEISRNREFYRTHDVRPPFTYAALIRQAIIESPDRQLTLNEIYTWFQNTFAYFRRNAATWKNAVRHNLSLHKCFMRVENVKGAVWTVDEVEYHRRRPQRGAGGSQSKSPPPSFVPYGADSLSYAAAAAGPFGGLSMEHQAYLHSLGVAMPSAAESPNRITESPIHDNRPGSGDESSGGGYDEPMHDHFVKVESSATTSDDRMTPPESPRGGGANKQEATPLNNNPLDYRQQPEDLTQPRKESVKNET